MSHESKINKQIALTIICAIISTAVFVMSLLNFKFLWIKITLVAILAILLIALVFVKTITLSKNEKQK